uniref:Uncharacterized protein n=1 Tax=Picea sitchensis TaxID=3332 RepID=A0A6B9XQD2_PICSI|nr:hypothetical protein Q903MT_gene3771 [Picea sitchensis]
MVNRNQISPGAGKGSSAELLQKVFPGMQRIRVNQSIQLGPFMPIPRSILGSPST